MAPDLLRVAIAETLDVALLTSDAKLASALGTSYQFKMV